MALRDHFRAPLDLRHSWDEIHGLWPGIMVQSLALLLPEEYIAAASIHLGSPIEVDVATFHETEVVFNPSSGGQAIATYAPPMPTLTQETKLQRPDEYEIRVYDHKRERRLVAAIEIVSPSNKDRPDNRETFRTKVAELVKQGVCVSIVDIVDTISFNLYSETLMRIDGFDPAVGDSPSAISAATLRIRRDGNTNRLETWYYPLKFGEPLPSLPIWITPTKAVSLDLNTTYETTCRTLRIR